MARDTMDALGVESFDSVYQDTIEPELKDRESGRRQALQTFGLAIFAGVLLCVIEFLLLPGFRGPQLWFVTVVLAGLAGYIPLRRVGRAAKTDVLTALCKPLGISYEASGFSPPAYETFRELRLLAPSDHNTFEDYFAGAREGRPFQLYEAKLVQGSGRSARTVFRGQLFKLAYPRPFDGVTVVLRDNGWLDRFACPPGLAKVGLEDPKFEEIFEVFGSDQVEARALLTPAVMEQVLALEAAYAGEHIRCAFVRGDMLVAVEGGNRFEMGSMFSTLVDRSKVESVANDLSAVFKLMDSFAFVAEPVITPSEPAVRPPARRRRRAAAA